MTAIAPSAVDMIDTWLYSVLSGDSYLTTLGVTGIYNTLAPEAAEFPLVTFAVLSGVDVTTEAALRVMSRQRYVLKAIGLSNTQAVLAPIAARIDLLLQMAGAVAWGTGWILTCIRQNSFALTTEDAGLFYRELNQTYLIQVQGG